MTLRVPFIADEAIERVRRGAACADAHARKVEAKRLS